MGHYFLVCASLSTLCKLSDSQNHAFISPASLLMLSCAELSTGEQSRIQEAVPRRVGALSLTWCYSTIILKRCQETPVVMGDVYFPECEEPVGRQVGGRKSHQKFVFSYSV